MKEQITNNTNIFPAYWLFTTKHQGLFIIQVGGLWNFNSKTIANFIVCRLLLHPFLHSHGRLARRNYPFVSHSFMLPFNNSYKRYTPIQSCRQLASPLLHEWELQVQKIYVSSQTGMTLQRRKNTLIPINSLQNGAGK